MNDTLARERAAAMLGLPANSEAAVARAAFLQRLERVDFVPPPAWCAGLNGLDERAVTGGFAIKYDDESGSGALHADLKEFCGQYWKLPIEQRRRQFAELDKRCRDDAWSQRHLMHLQKGLAVESRDFWGAGGLQATIASIIQELFVLPKIQRANERNARLAGARPGADWRSAARSFRKEYPQLAALDAELLQRLEDMPPGWDQPMPVRHAASTAPAQKSGVGWPVYLIIFVIIGIIRAASGSSSSTRSTYNTPDFKTPTYQNYSFPKTYYSQSPSPFPPGTNPPRVTLETERLVAELNRLVFDLQTQPSDTAYQKLKFWLNSSKGATVRSRPGSSEDLWHAEQCLKDYEKSLTGPKKTALPKDSP